MQPMMPAGAVCAVHPVIPATGTCGRCGNFICGQCLGPEGGAYCEKCRALGAGGRVLPPWERRDELGFVTAAIEQWKLSMFKPEQFWRSLPAEGSSTDPLLFAWLMGVLQAIPSFFVQMLNYGQMKTVLGQLGKTGLPPFLTDMSPAVYAAMITLPVLVFYPLSFYLGSAITHLGCKMWGAGPKGFTATARVMGYSQAPMLLAWVPLVGFVAAIYLLVQEVMGIARVHEVDTGKAIAGVLTIPLILGCCCGAGAIALVGAALGAR